MIFIFAFLLLLAATNSANASTFSDDLYWFKNVLQFSETPQTGIDSFLNPSKGRLQSRLNRKKAPWAGNYFPMDKGGLAFRWQKCPAGDCSPLYRENAMQMTPEQIAVLSPIEKYDLLNSDYSFNATHFELINRGPLRDLPPQDWEGFCNGVRCAGMILDEPRFPITITNSEGIKIKFEPADLKALAGANYFYVEKYGQIGGPTQNGMGTNQPNAAVFDLALRFYLGKNQKGFVIDSHLGAEIWNESVVGYKRVLSTPLELTFQEKQFYPEAVSKISVELTLETLGEVDITETNKATKRRISRGRFLTPLVTGYDLYLNAQGQMIDGQWHPATSERGVDFAWFAEGKGMDSEYQTGNKLLKFEKILPLIKESAHPSCNLVFH